MSVGSGRRALPLARGGTGLLLALFVPLFFPLPSSAESLVGRVVGIADGDTLTVLDDRKSPWRIRLAGIDAPEKGQPFGKVSKRNLSDLAFGRTAVVEWQKVDRWKRLVGTVSIGGVDVGLRQIRDGLAWHFKAYENEQPEVDRRLYAEAEQGARRGKVGLWRDPSPTPPWVYRRERRKIERPHSAG